MNFHVGEQVRVIDTGKTRDPNGMGAGKMWLNSWENEMDEAHYGKGLFTIEEIDPDLGIKFVDHTFYYPANVLKKELH
jgi:hypothetical protein